MWSRFRAGASLALLTALVLLGCVPPAPASVLPPNFEDQLVTDAVPAPTALAFTPDGRTLIADRNGRLRVYKNGGLLSTAALDISSSVCTNADRGLLGVAVDPTFTPSSDNYVYLFYTFKKFGVCDTSGPNVPVNRVSRFTLGSNDIIDPASELVLIDNTPSTTGHNAGDVQFGKDGYLYVSRGDAGSPSSARDLSTLLGKILRITRDGGIPPTNPLQGLGTDRCNLTGGTVSTNKCQEIYAWGLRNPFRIVFDPNQVETRFYINDVGHDVWEEIDLGQAGADYGWAVREGPCAFNSTTDCGPPPPGMTNPIYAYDHSGGCASITGGAFIPFGIWPPAYDGAYLYQDFVCGKIFRLVPDGSGGFTASEFGSGFNLNSLVGMTFGPHGAGRALYYYTYNAPGAHVRRIVYTGARSYPAPTGGATLRAQLVPAFGECTASNSLHGGNLASDDSCSDPQLRSSTVTLGNSTTLGTRLGYASATVCTAPQPPAGTCSISSLGGPAPDVRLRGNGSDVVCRAGAPLAACPGGAGSDYDPSPLPGPYTTNLDSGTDSNVQVPQPVCNPAPPNPSSCAVGADMTATAVIPASTSSAGSTIRVTDRYSSLQSSGDPAGCEATTSCSATVRDQEFSVPVVCRATASISVGSYCGVNTTANALVPGVVEAGRGAVVQLGQLQVFDSGPDGVRGNSDDQLFAVQGIFVP